MSAPKWFRGRPVGSRSEVRGKIELIRSRFGFIRDSPESLSRNPSGCTVPSRHSQFLDCQLGVAIDKIDIMKITKNIGMLSGSRFT